MPNAPRVLVMSLLLLGLPMSSAMARQPTPEEIEQRAASILKQMTLEEKIDYIGGVDSFYVRAVPRLGLPALRMADGPLGVRNYGPSTAYAAGIALAASWDTDLAGRVGATIGHEARARGVHFLLGPAVNIYRAPMCGRNFEYMGEDPFLAARMAVAYIQGVQAQGVSATIKHFMGNNSEVDRHGTSSDMDERTMREIYLPAFEAAVKEAHVGAIMNSYNLVNGVHATQHDLLNQSVAKKEWGFDGIIMSDWDATYDGVAAANAGLDLEMPSGKFMNRATLLPAVKQGKVPETAIDDKVRRILRKAIQFGWLDRDQTDRTWPLLSQRGRKVALESARSSMVLLKNDGNLLPLDKKKIKSVAVIGPDAYPAVPIGGGSARVRPFAAVSLLEGISRLLADGATVHFLQGLTTLSEVFDSTEFVTSVKNGRPGLAAEYFDNDRLAGAPSLRRVDGHVNFDWHDSYAPGAPRKPFSARWKGYYVAPTTGEYRLAASTYGLDDYWLFVDGKLIMHRADEPQPITVKNLELQAGKSYAIRFEYSHHDHHAQLGLGIRAADKFLDPAVKTLAARVDAVVVAAGFDPMNEAEGYDRTFELPLGQDELIRTVRAANRNTVVAITSGGAVDMTKWIADVPAILELWYPGQEGGTALAEILFGDVSPSGKLPVSFERRWEDNAVHDSYYPRKDHRLAYREGVFLGYRHFDRAKTKPLFPFGHGLSYTTFRYQNLAVTPAALQGDGTVTVSFDVSNTGKRAGAEVAQVYVSDGHSGVPRPAKELKGFAKVKLKPGEARRISVKLDRRALSYFDEKSKKWKATPGEFTVLVGRSSQAIELRGGLTLR
jgi:beta-glucosidase